MIRKKRLRLVDRRIASQKKKNVSESIKSGFTNPEGLTGLEETLAELQYAMAHLNEYKPYTNGRDVVRDMLGDCNKE